MESQKTSFKYNITIISERERWMHNVLNKWIIIKQHVQIVLYQR